jgi:hypothetical protein
VNLNYGVSVSSERQLLELPELRQADFLELNCQLLDSPDFFLPPAWRGRVFRCSGRSESRAFSALVEAGASIQQDFYRVFSRRCEKFSQLGGRELSFCIDLENTFSEVEYAAKLRKILSCCFGIMEKYRLQPLLEVRVPGIAASRRDDLIKFMNSLLYPVRLLTDIHPHEPGALELLGEFLDKLHYESGRLRISFDGDGGNYLSDKLLERLRSFIRPVGREVPDICFYPGRNADKTVFAALASVMS